MSRALLILDTVTGLILGSTSDPNVWIEAHHRLVPAPVDFATDPAEEWVWDDGLNALVHDPACALDGRKAVAIARIKQDAAERIAALDWKVQRAQEREKAEWATPTETAAVLAEREAIRQSSDAAEGRLMALTTFAEVDAFTWTVDVIVPAPRLLTQKQFAERLTDAELTALIHAAQQNPAIGAWLERFRAAKDMNLDAPMAQTGVWALEMAGLLAPGRTLEILR